MKRIPLSRGRYALVDDEDFERLVTFRWHCDSYGYAKRSIHIGNRKHRNVAMHREILGITDSDILVDHMNGDRVDNRRSNLRLSTKSTNGCNRNKTRANTSGYKGVTKHNQCKSDRWIAQIRVNNRNRYLGLFTTPELAAAAYNRAAVTHFGEFAKLNNIVGV